MTIGFAIASFMLYLVQATYYTVELYNGSYKRKSDYLIRMIPLLGVLYPIYKKLKDLS